MHDLEALDFGRPLALCFGNERFGVSDQMRAECDLAFTIRLHGLGESLNVAVAHNRKICTYACTCMHAYTSR